MQIQNSLVALGGSVILSSGIITDMVGNRFTGSSWNYTLVNPEVDQDSDGLTNKIEIEMSLTDPMVADSDGDSLTDGIETTSNCLNPLVNDENKHMHMVTISEILATMNRFRL